MPDTRWTLLDKWYWLHAALADKRLRPATLRVAGRLSWHAEIEGGAAWPGLEIMAANTGLDTGTIQKSTRQLKKYRYIERVRGRTGTGAAAKWRLLRTPAHPPTGGSNGPRLAVQTDRDWRFKWTATGGSNEPPKIYKENIQELRAREAGGDQPARPPGLVDPPDGLAGIWAAISAGLHGEFGDGLWHSWIEPATLASDSASGVVVVAHSAYAADYLKKFCGDRLEELWRKAGFSCRIVAP